LRSPGTPSRRATCTSYLPRERALVTGDLLVNPITYALFCYPTGWIAALERLDAFNATWIIPGHGAPMRSEKLLHDTHDLLVRERKLALELKASGRSVEYAKKEVILDQEVRRLREAIAGLDPSPQELLNLYLVGWFVSRVYDEADGRLDDQIPMRP
jgi:glyoxylase-like metal-dependent hydrolase (beta-lactamase superfamily II)